MFVLNDMRNSKWICWITLWEHGLWVAWEWTCAEITHTQNKHQFRPKKIQEMRGLVYMSTFLLL